MKSKLELSLDEVVILLRRLEYSYKKKGSPLCDKLKHFVEENQSHVEFESIKIKLGLTDNLFKSSALFCGTLFDTIGDEREFVMEKVNKSPNKVLTLMNKKGKMYIINGYHPGSGHFISKKDIIEKIEIEL